MFYKQIPISNVLFFVCISTWVGSPCEDLISCNPQGATMSVLSETYNGSRYNRWIYQVGWTTPNYKSTCYDGGWFWVVDPTWIGMLR